MAKKKIEDMTPEELRAHNAELARAANQNRNHEQLARRDAIASDLDDSRGGEFQDIDGDRILPKKKPTRSAEETEEAAAREEERAEAERARLAAAGEEADDDEDDQAGPDDQDGDEGEEESEAASDSRLTNGVRYYRCIVNGKEKWLTLSQLRNTASKVEAADEYLQNAAASVRRAAELDPSAEDGRADEEVDDAEELLNKALLGDQESVKKLAQRLKATPSRVTPDVLQAVDERMTFREAVNWFEDEFETELSDPRLKAMIVEEDARLARETPTMGYRQRLKKAGTTIRKWRASLTGGAAEDGEGGTEGDSPKPRPEKRPSIKEQRKRTLDDIPAAGGRQASGDTEGTEETVGTVIEGMARARHQGRAIKH